jgi:hypothetical protein
MLAIAQRLSQGPRVSFVPGTGIGAFSQRPLSPAFRPFIGPFFEGQLRVELTPLPSRCRMSGNCAFRPAGVDVKRSLQIGTIHTLDAGPLEVQALYCLVGPLK